MKDQEMEREGDPVASSWDALTPSVTFDEGSLPWTDVVSPTRPVGEEAVVGVGVGTPMSLLVQSLVQQLCGMVEQDGQRAHQLYEVICEKLHRVRLLDATYAMGEFEVMRREYQRALQQLVSVARGSQLPALVQGWPLPSTQHAPSRPAPPWSRYRTEFQEKSFIAKGGFGRVFCARNRLDGMEYAIKKIKICSSELDSFLGHLREVKTFAILSHPNIVSYKAAWLEPLLEPEEEAPPSEDPSFSLTSDSPVYDNVTEDKSSLQICFESSPQKAEIMERLGNLNISGDTTDYKILSKVESDQRLLTFKTDTVPHLNLHYATLFIQMSLCQGTLKKWLQQHSPRAPEAAGEVLDVFSQLCCGLQYIHACGITHHDIKPSNIFITSTGPALHVQLGDFGLACPLQRSHRGAALGTPLYAAPEQLLGICNKNSDLYSVGVLLVEMLMGFRTSMERVEVLQGVRAGQLPSEVAQQEELARLVSRLTHQQAEQRGDTAQLLAALHTLSPDKERIIQALRQQLTDKDHEIARLREIIANR